MIRLMRIGDYDEIYQLWKRTPGVGLRSLDDSREGIHKFLLRNPNTNFVTLIEDKIVGVVLGGQDQRRGYLYHVCVDPEFRRRSIGRKMILTVAEAMKVEGITKLSIVAFSDNELGNSFWRDLGWELRNDLNIYSFDLVHQQ